MLEDIKNGFFIFVGILAALTLIMNMDRRIPRFPWDLFFDRFGFSVYLPVTTSLVLAMLVMVLLSMAPTP
jgi:hypothetical protein